MKGELYRIYIIFLLVLFLIFVTLKFIYLDIDDSEFWRSYMEQMLESIKLGGVHL